MNQRLASTIALMILLPQTAGAADPIEGQLDRRFGLDEQGFASFGFAAVANDHEAAASIIRTSDGKFLVFSTTEVPYMGGERKRYGLTRLLANGQIDVAFHNGPYIVPVPAELAELNFNARSLHQLADGKLLSLGNRSPGASQICRHAIAGNFDASYGDAGCVHHVLGLVEQGYESAYESAVNANDEVLVTGGVEDNPAPGFDTSIFVWKLDANGDPVQGWGLGTGYQLIKPMGCDWCTPGGVLWLDDGSVLVAGSDQIGASFVAKLNPQGQLDFNFGAGGIAAYDFGDLHQIPGAQEFAASMDVDSQGRIYTCGRIRASNDNRRSILSVARLLANGDLDTDYSGDGRIIMPFNDLTSMTTPSRCRVDAQDRLVVGATIGTEIPENNDMAMLRFTMAGDLDPQFNFTGTSRLGFDFGGPGVGQDDLADWVFDNEGIVIAGHAGTSNAHDPNRKHLVTRLTDDQLHRDGFE